MSKSSVMGRSCVIVHFCRMQLFKSVHFHLSSFILYFKYGCQTSEASLSVSLLITFSDSSNPDQDQQNVSPDLGTNCSKV